MLVAVLEVLDKQLLMEGGQSLSASASTSLHEVLAGLGIEEYAKMLAMERVQSTAGFEYIVSPDDLPSRIPLDVRSRLQGFFIYVFR